MLGGVAILDNDTLIAESLINVKIAHSERLMPEIDHMLKRSNLNMYDIDVFAISIGPGSFTGLRVGLSAVKGLVYATGKKLVSVSTLEAFAWNLPFSKYQVCPVLDARKKEVYAAIFRWNRISPESGFESVMNERVIKIEQLLETIYEPTIFLGEGAVIYKGDIEKKAGDLAVFGQPQNMVPYSSRVAYLGMLKAKKGEYDDPASLVPRYLRKSEAEIKKQSATD